MSGSRTPGRASSRAATRSRRTWKASRIAATQSCGPVRAATAACWLMLEGLLVSWLWRLAIAFESGSGAIVQPIRQPVIE